MRRREDCDGTRQILRDFVSQDDVPKFKTHRFGLNLIAAPLNDHSYCTVNTTCWVLVALPDVAVTVRL
jgi:hypothetical protein